MSINRKRNIPAKAIENIHIAGSTPPPSVLFTVVKCYFEKKILHNMLIHVI